MPSTTGLVLVRSCFFPLFTGSFLSFHVLFSIAVSFPPLPPLKQALNIDRQPSGRHLDLCSQAEVALSPGTEGISSMEGEHGSNKWWRGTISMLEITPTQGLLDHDTSQAVLIIWTAPSAPLIFYPQQFIGSSVCTHTLIHSPLHQKKKAFSPVPVCMVRCFCMAYSDDSEMERQSER